MKMAAVLSHVYLQKFHTITTENGTEYHAYRALEETTGVPFYFATPHHSWECGTNKNTNGLLRQYVPKGRSMASLTQSRCDAIAETLNNRPRKRTPNTTPLIGWRRDGGGSKGSRLWRRGRASAEGRDRWRAT